MSGSSSRRGRRPASGGTAGGRCKRSERAPAGAPEALFGLFGTPFAPDPRCSACGAQKVWHATLADFFARCAELGKPYVQQEVEGVPVVEPWTCSGCDNLGFSMGGTIWG